jgi:hypothetical protein
LEQILYDFLAIKQFLILFNNYFLKFQVDIQLRDTCTSGVTGIQIGNIRATTHQPSKGKTEEQTGLSTGLLIALVAIVAILLLAIFVLIYFCLQRKKPAYKKKKNSSEYATKGEFVKIRSNHLILGHPVVFPDEMPPHDDETNGATAAVTTPMLVAQEHPPLNPPASDPSITLHENPIYKPSAGTPTRQPPPYVAP